MDKKEITKEIHVNYADESYKVTIGNKLDIANIIKKNYTASKIAVITDNIVNDIYGKYISKSLKKEEFDVFFIVINSGEEYKNLDTVSSIYESLARKNFTRSDLIIALGGGIVGDVAAFVASTYMRGLPFINIPTTLLAQVDSCIGGKTGVNTDFGKNMVGTFYNPIAVIVDVNFLVSLDDKLISDGVAEIVKYGMIYDEDMFKLLEKNDLNTIRCIFEKLVYNSLMIKKFFVENDSHDNGIRMILNFGHTYGHLIEKYFNYEKYSHGQAVAMGIVYITRKTEATGYTKIGTVDRIISLMKKYNLPYNMPEIDTEKLDKMLLFDKKNRSGVLNFIHIKEIGKAEIIKKRID